jgi:hypothetical protein
LTCRNASLLGHHANREASTGRGTRQLPAPGHARLRGRAVSFRSARSRGVRRAWRSAWPTRRRRAARRRGRAGAVPVQVVPGCAGRQQQHGSIGHRGQLVTGS